ncbi:MAG: YtxH domain-containing protein [Actinobacteria bacterium]|nr:YtxH domain-containing protein [Actinomycetota bacterium]
MCGDSNDNGTNALKYGLIGFAVGAVAGALAALFLTTKTGEELRSEIRKAIIDVRQKAEEQASKIKNVTKEKYEEIVQSILSGYNKAKEFTEKEIELIKKILIEQKENQQQ